jgi:prophage maintenance system killer protein
MFGMEILTKEDVLKIYLALVTHGADAGEPIVPSGVREIALLESALSRQHTGLGGTLKYPEPRDNAATLLYGICMDHPFFNGNKRTAFVASLVHLDRNGYIPQDVSEREFYNMLISLADHRLTSGVSAPRGGKTPLFSAQAPQRLSADEEVKAVGDWLKRRTRRVDKNEHPLTFRQLRRIISRFGCRFGEPHGNFVDLYLDEEYLETGFLGLGKPRRKVRQSKVTQLSYAGEGAFVPINTIKMVRKHCHLLAENGIDSRAFYDEEATVDYFLNQYRNLLKRLAKA